MTAATILARLADAELHADAALAFACAGQTEQARTLLLGVDRRLSLQRKVVTRVRGGRQAFDRAWTRRDEAWRALGDWRWRSRP